MQVIEVYMQDEILSLYDIYSVYHIPWWQQEAYVHSIALVICLLLVIIACSIAFIFYKKAQKILYSDPWLHYIKELDHVYAKQQMNKEDIKYFYDTSTYLLKQ